MTTDLEERIQEFLADATKILDAGKTALNQLGKGDVQTACNMISLSHYPISHVRGDYDGILEAFEAQGVTPDKGV